MHVETMIAMYGLICASMIVFNIIYNLRLRGTEHRNQIRCEQLKAKIEPQLERIQQDLTLDELHLKFLRRKLKKINHLIAFDQVLDEFSAQQHTLTAEYLHQIQPAMLYLAISYEKREDMQSAFFAYLLSKHVSRQQCHAESIQELLLDYVQKQNLYCRLNALRALFQMGNIDFIVSAVKQQDDGAIFLHEKILTELFLSFPGEHHHLIARLWTEWNSFSLHTQISILNYIRFQSGDYPEEMFTLMQCTSANKELRLAAIRYLGKYPFMPALDSLSAFVRERDPDRWEYATVAASALAAYPEELVIGTLKQALYSENWYIRSAAAQSLETLDVDYSEILDIVIGNDRYAREMMTYHLESRMLQHREVTAK